MTDIPLQYSNEPADRAFTWEATHSGATLVFPPRPRTLLSIINDTYEPVLAILCLVAGVWMDSFHRSMAGAWPLWAIVFAFGIANRIRQTLASQPNTVQIFDGWMKVDSPVSHALRKKRFWFEPLLPVRLDSKLSKIEDVRVEATGIHYRGYMLGKIVIRTTENRYIYVGAGRPVRELEQAEKLLRRAMYTAGWHPPRTMLMKIGRSLGSGLHKITHV